MQMINTGSDFPGESAVTFLPMIDMNPSDETYIYSTMLWVSRHAKRYNTTPMLTFDQPLWYKATMIRETEPQASEVKKIVLRLGAFHAEMSFLGAIGHIMTDSGLQEVLATVYAERAVGHMLIGKAISRALRGHGLVHMALNLLLISDVFQLEGAVKENVPQECETDGAQTEESQVLEPHCLLSGDVRSEEVSDKDLDVNDELVSDPPVMSESNDIDSDLKCAMDLFDSVLTGDISPEQACNEDVAIRIKQRIDTYCSKISSEGRTAKLWIQYLEMIDLLRDFIRAERLGDWQLHLQTLRSMLPYYAAAGHNLYAKSVYIYLSHMQKLPTTHPDVHRYFKRGFHVVRRSNRLWAGLSTDLVIEQALMRSLKSSGGLTRGRGMTEIQRAIWVLSRPATSSVNEAMQAYSGVEYSSSEQHKDTNPSVRKRDEEDTKIIRDYLVDRNPFTSTRGNDLMSIASGVVSKDSNVDKAEQTGYRIIERMAGKKVNDFVFKKKEAVIQMNDTSAVKIDNETVTVDPQLLFQRLVTISSQISDEPDVPLSYELSTFPPALFESRRQMREADKPALAKAMKTPDNPTANTHDTSDSQYSIVVDGGMLLQWVLWEEGKSFEEICDAYVRFLQSRYTNCIVVFDGYEGGPSTKDATHFRRSNGIVGAEVKFASNTIFRGKKSTFLNNEKNKQSFIFMLSEKLNNSGIDTKHADFDADVLIVSTAVQCSLSKPTILVGEDTDLLVLLCYHARSDSYPVYLQSKPKLTHSECWNIHQLQGHLGGNVCKHILFLHAILGCDTTSRVHGIGKGAALKLFSSNQSFQNVATVFQQAPNEATKDDVIKSGERALVCLFKGRDDQTLDKLRVDKFVEKVAKSSIFVDPKCLPPTVDAAMFHSLRVYLQVQLWKGVSELNPIEWGWELMGNRLCPIPQTKAAAPGYILKVIRCTCKAGCKSKACSCKKLGIECGPACSSCKGVSCANSFQPDLDYDD